MSQYNSRQEIYPPVEPTLAGRENADAIDEHTHFSNDLAITSSAEFDTETEKNSELSLSADHPDINADQLRNMDAATLRAACEKGLGALTLKQVEFMKQRAIKHLSKQDKQSQETEEHREKVKVVKPEKSSKDQSSDNPKEITKSRPAVLAADPAHHVAMVAAERAQTALENTHQVVKELVNRKEVEMHEQPQKHTKKVVAEPRLALLSKPTSKPTEIVQIKVHPSEQIRRKEQFAAKAFISDTHAKLTLKVATETVTPRHEPIRLDIKEPVAQAAQAEKVSTAKAPPVCAETTPSAHLIPKNSVSPKPIETAETVVLFEPMALQGDAAENTTEQTDENPANIILPDETFAVPIEFEENEPDMEIDQAAVETRTYNIETETACVDIMELTAELNDLFLESPEIEPLEPWAVLPVLETLEDTEPSGHELAGEPQVPDELFAPFIETLREQAIETEPIKPELIEAVTRLEAVLAAAPEEQLELTEQVVKDIITVLTQLGCEEPHKVLIEYAKTHSLPELFAELEKVLPELSKLIDYQQHLLAALNRASTRSDRYFNIARLLSSLLITFDRQAA